MNVTKTIAVTSLAATALGFASFTASADDTPAQGKLVVEVLHIENDKGKIGCSLFAKAEGFPSDANKALRSLFVRPKNRKASCVFNDVKPGTYAVSVMHDLNDDGELETSMLGRPKEPWGVSNDVPAERFGPPKFKPATFKYAGKEMTLKVKLHD